MRVNIVHVALCWMCKYSKLLANKLTLRRIEKGYYVKQTLMFRLL